MSTTTATTWKDIPGFPNYQASTDGQIRSLDREIVAARKDGTEFRYRKDGVVLKPCAYTLYGHLHVGVTDENGCRRQRPVHTLVLLAFDRPKAANEQCRHIDGNPANNCLDNLCWGTLRENIADRIEHGTSAVQGSRRVLTKERVLEIRRRHRDGEPLYDLIREWGVSHGTIYSVTSGRTWNHVRLPA